MKTLRLLFFFSVMFVSSLGFAQIVINQSDIWAVGDTIPRVVDTLAPAGPGSKGANQTWNFSTAQPRVIETTRIVNASATPYASSFTTANQAMTHDNSSYLFVNSSASNVVIKGLVGDLLGTGGSDILQFNPDLLLMQFPESYGSNYSDTYGFDFVGSGASFGVYQIHLKHSAIVYDSVDGWGTIITPTGSYNSLRKKTVEFKKDSTWYKLFSFSGWTFDKETLDTVTSYTWLAKETKLAVAELSLNDDGSPHKLTYSLIPPAVSTGISTKALSGFKLFPNPTNDQIHFIPLANFTTSGSEIRIYDSFGREVFRSKNLTSGETTIDISQLSNGIYYLEASQNNQLKGKELFSVIR